MALRSHKLALPQSQPSSEDILASLSKAHTLIAQADNSRLDDAINQGLALIGQAFAADRAYVFKLTDPLYLCNTHEWCAPGICALKDELQQTPYGMGEPFWTAFSAQNALLLHDVATVPAGSDLRAMLDLQGVKSLIAVAIWHDTEFAGFMGMDFCRAKRQLSITDAHHLHGYAATLGCALQARDARVAKREVDTELRAARDRLGAMVQARPELLVETNHNGRVTSFHQSGAMTFAISPVEVIGKPPEAFMPAHVAALCRRAMDQVDRAGWSDTFVYTLRIGNQDKHFALHAAAKGHAHSPRRNGYIFVVRDVTESHRQNLHLRQLGRVAELSTNMIFLTDANRRISWINPASTKRTGFSLNDAIGKWPSEILGLSRHDPTRATAICAKLDRGEDIREDVQGASQSGIPFWVSLNVRRLTDADGILQGFMVVGTDITVHKLAETRALRDRSSTMNALSEGIAIIQPDGTLAYLNPALRSFLDIPDSLAAENLSWQDISPDGLSRRLVSLLPELYATGSWRGEFLLPDAAAVERHFEISISVQDDGSFLFISHDISARKMAERDQALLRDQLQIAHGRQLVAQLASGLAHDVANVLGVISGAIETIRPTQRPDMTRALERMDTATSQAQALVRNLSQLGQRSATQTRLDLRPLVAQAADLVRPSLDRKTGLDVTLPETPVKVLGDKTAIMQVLLNLILNARDAICPKARRAGRITLCLHPPAPYAPEPAGAIGRILPDTEYAMIEITDTGIGLDKTQQAEMFKPYFSTKGENGVGLGLSIVADILTAHLGAAHVQSQPGKGTQVQVFWPVTIRAQKAPQKPDAAPLSGCHVLLVDDDDEDLMQMAGILTKAGAEVASCIDPRDALAALRESPDDWDIIITDQDMAPMTGEALARDIQAISPNLPIILATGAGPLQTASKSAHGVYTSILRKPVTDAVIVAALLDAVLRHKHISQTADHCDATPTGR